MHRYVIFSRYYSVYVPYTCLWVFSGSTYNCLFQKTRCLRYRQMFVLSGVYVQLFVSGDSVFTDKCLCFQGSTYNCLFQEIRCLLTNTSVVRVYLQTFVSGDSVFTDKYFCCQGSTYHCLFQEIRCLPTNTCVFRVYINCLFQEIRCLQYWQMFVLSGVIIQLFVSGDSVFTDKYVCCQGSSYNCLLQETRCLLTNICVSGVYIQLFVSGDSVFTDKYLCFQGLPTNVCFRRFCVYAAEKCLCFQGTTVIKPSTRCLSGHSTQATKAAPSPESSTPTTYVTWILISKLSSSCVIQCKGEFCWFVFTLAS